MSVQKEMLEKYKKSLKSAWGYNDYNDWPVKVNSVTHLFLKEFADEILEDMQEIRGDVSLQDRLKEQFYNPARLYRLIDPIIFGLRRRNYPLARQREIVMELLTLVQGMKAGSIFNEDGRNIIFQEKKVEQLDDEMDYIYVDGRQSKLIQRFCGIMWAYTESVFFRAHEVTKEIHGCYEKGDQQLIVREYLNLRPQEIWGERVPYIGYRKIIVYAWYDRKLRLRIDAYNHLFLDAGNYVDDMVRCCVVADGKFIDICELNQIMADAMKTIETVHIWSEAADWREITKKYAEIYWYRKSPFRNVLGKPSGIPGQVVENIDGGEPDARRIHNLSEKQIARLIQIVI